MPAMPSRLSFAFSVCAALAPAMLAGCASDDSAARFLVAPDKYVLYTCPEIAREMAGKEGREKELAQLMAKNGTDASARMISDLTYQPEYLSVRGEINDLHASAAAKNCNAPTGAAAAAPPGAAAH
jgi:hypothetical protein